MVRTKTVVKKESKIKHKRIIIKRSLPKRNHKHFNYLIESIDSKVFVKKSMPLKPIFMAYYVKKNPNSKQDNKEDNAKQ